MLLIPDFLVSCLPGFKFSEYRKNSEFTGKLFLDSITLMFLTLDSIPLKVFKIADSESLGFRLTRIIVFSNTGKIGLT